VNYTPTILPTSLEGLLPWLARELQTIAFTINEKTQRLWYSTAILTPAQLTGNTNDWAPPGLEGALWIRMSANGSYNLTGLKNPEAGTPRMFFLTNVGTNNITMIDSSGASAAAARFALPNGTNQVMGRNDSALIAYDTSSSLWRALSNAV
jgi:hypothetical protein